MNLRWKWLLPEYVLGFAAIAVATRLRLGRKGATMVVASLRGSAVGLRLVVLADLRSASDGFALPRALVAGRWSSASAPGVVRWWGAGSAVLPEHRGSCGFSPGPLPPMDSIPRLTGVAPGWASVSPG